MLFCLTAKKILQSLVLLSKSYAITEGSLCFKLFLTGPGSVYHCIWDTLVLDKTLKPFFKLTLKYQQK